MQCGKNEIVECREGTSPSAPQLATPLTPPDILAVFRGRTSKGTGEEGKGEGMRGGEKRKGEKKEKTEEGREERSMSFALGRKRKVSAYELYQLLLV